LNAADIHALTKNAFTASFLSDADKQRYIAELDRASGMSATRGESSKLNSKPDSGKCDARYAD
jgi:adenosine deaminase